MKCFFKILKRSILLLFLLKTLQINGQQRAFTKDNQVIDIELFDLDIYIIQKLYNDQLYFFPISFFDDYIQTNSTFKLYTINLKDLQCDSFFLELPSNKKKIKQLSNLRTKISDFIVLDNSVYVLTHSVLIHFKIKEGEYIFKDIITLPKNHNASYLNNYDKKHAIISYHYNADPPKKRVYSAKIKLRNGKIKKELTFEIPNIAFSHQSPLWWAFSDKYLSLAGNTDYKIWFFDKTSFQLVDSLTYDKSGYKENPDELNSFNLDNKNSILDLRIKAKQFNRIEKIFMMNDTTVLIFHRKTNDSKEYLDFWKKINSKWSIIIEDGIVSGISPNPDTILKNNNFLSIGYYSGQGMSFYNEKIITLGSFYVNHAFFYNKSYREFTDCIWHGKCPNKYLKNTTRKMSINFHELSK